MKSSTILALALCSVASADYLLSSPFIGSGTCEGVSYVNVASSIDCETTGATSYAMQCINNTAAQLLTYVTNTDCSGEPDYTSDYPVVFGCAVDDTSSSMITCASGKIKIA